MTNQTLCLTKKNIKDIMSYIFNELRQFTFFFSLECHLKIVSKNKQLKT